MVAEDRKERSLFLKTLQAEFRDNRSNSKDSAFTLVANMLTNMQDATPRSNINSQLKQSKFNK